MNIELSIIIPVYNVEQYLEECLDSIYAVENIRKEVILVNDGSTDNSLEILKRYERKYSNITVLIDKRNGGLSSARNAGIKVARGEYISFIDSDDWVDSKNYEDFFKAGKKLRLDIIISEGFIKCYLKGETKLDEVYPKNFNNCIIAGKYFLEESYSKNIYRVETCNKIYKRRLILDNNLYFKEGIIYEDELFTPLIFFEAKKVKKINRIFYNYRQREGSIMRENGIRDFFSKYKIYFQLLFDKKFHSKILIKKIFWCYQFNFSNAKTLYLKEHFKLLFLPNLTFQDRLWLLKVLRCVKEIKWSIEKGI